jgi:starch-binding outer membrane protein, SusD/RagB family
VAINLNDWAGALAALQGSFLDVNAPLTLGTYHSFGTGSGDTQNGSFDPTGRSLRGHLSFMTDAQLQSNGSPDARTAKQAQAAAPLTVQGVTSSRLVVVYNSASSPIPIIRNEELILLRAEANIGLGNVTAAIADINVIRTRSGGLPAYSGPTTAAAVLDELLYNKRYSLYFEGRRWIDLRRYNRLATLPRDLSTHRVFTQWPFPLNECLARGLNSGACGPVAGT